MWFLDQYMYLSHFLDKMQVTAHIAKYTQAEKKKILYKNLADITTL